MNKLTSVLPERWARNIPGHNETINGKRRRSREYYSYFQMMQRCYRKKAKDYHRYGGRGILVTDRWVGNFLTFLEDMGPRPLGTTLSRINNELPYCPSNCRWESYRAQGRNRCTKSNIGILGITSVRKKDRKDMYAICILLTDGTSIRNNRTGLDRAKLRLQELVSAYKSRLPEDHNYGYIYPTQAVELGLADEVIG